MINTLWMLIILLGVAGIFAVTMKRKIEFVFAFSIFTVIAVLYGFSLAGAPVAGYQVVRAIGVLAFIVCGILLLAKRETREYVLTPGCVAFILVAFVAWWGHRGQMYIYQDEFSHWGRACNQLYKLQKLPHGEPGGILSFHSYPPGSTLFYTFWCWLGGAFSEGGTLSACNVFLISCMFPMMQWASWKKWKRILPLMFICILLPIAFYTPTYQTLVVDGLLGCVTAYALIIWFTSKQDSFAVAAVSGALFVLPLIKESGAALAILVLVIILLDILKSRKTDWKKMVIPAAGMVIAIVSWKLYRNIHGIVGEKSFRYDQIVENIRLMLDGKSRWEQEYLFQNFFRYLTWPSMMGKGNIIQLSYVSWVLVFAAVACWIKRRDEINCFNHRASRGIWCLLAGTWIYALVLFHLYLYSFADWEAAGLHSFDRYMSTIMLVALATTIAFVLQALENQPLKTMPGVLAVVMGLVLVINPEHIVDLTFAAPMHIESVQQARADMCPPQFFLNYVGEDDMIAWLATEGDQENWLPYAITRYELLPAQVQQPFGVVADANIEASAIAHRLAKGDWSYVYCYDLKEENIDNIAELFEDPDQITDGTLYRVVKDGSTAKLERLY